MYFLPVSREASDMEPHDKARMDESSENNKSLMKCVKAKAKMAQEDGCITLLLKVRTLNHVRFNNADLLDA